MHGAVTDDQALRNAGRALRVQVEQVLRLPRAGPRDGEGRRERVQAAAAGPERLPVVPPGLVREHAEGAGAGARD